MPTVAYRVRGFQACTGIESTSRINIEDANMSDADGIETLPIQVLEANTSPCEFCGKDWNIGFMRDARFCKPCDNRRRERKALRSGMLLR